MTNIIDDIADAIRDEPKATTGAPLLDELHDALGRYVAFPSPHAHDAMTAWIAATHAQAAWEHAPRAAVISPEKRCGKSRLMDVAEATSHRSLITTNISPAALVRSIDDDPPTMFIDEADSVFSKKTADSTEDLRGIVNAGHQRNRPYLRWDIKSRQTEACPTFAMAMLASIGDLPATIMDRAIVVRMRRRGPGEKIDPFRTRRDGPALRQLGIRLSEWAGEHLDELREAVPTMPVEDRAADTWEPLVSICDLAGGDWPKRIRDACIIHVAAADATEVEGSLGQKLLADVQQVFKSEKVNFIASRDLVDSLKELDDTPWSDLNLTMNGLARKLQRYGIRPGQDSTGKARGYHEKDFRDAFSRYLPSETVRVSEQGSDQDKASDTSRDPDCQSNCQPEPSDTSSDSCDSANCQSVSAAKPDRSDSLTVQDSLVREQVGSESITEIVQEAFPGAELIDQKPSTAPF